MSGFPFLLLVWGLRVLSPLGGGVSMAHVGLSWPWAQERQGVPGELEERSTGRNSGITPHLVCALSVHPTSGCPQGQPTVPQKDPTDPGSTTGSPAASKSPAHMCFSESFHLTRSSQALTLLPPCRQVVTRSHQTSLLICPIL